MKAYTELPTGYRQIFSVNLQKDKNIMLLINIAAVVIAVVLAVPMHFHIAITAMFNMDHGFLQYILRFIVLIAGIIIYTVLHGLQLLYL